MTSKREEVLSALHALLLQLPGPSVQRNEPLPIELPAGGLVILRDGSPGEPEVTLSPSTWVWHHLTDLEVLMPGETQALRDAALDALLQQLGALLATDPTLGGLCDWVEAQAPETEDLTAEGAAPVKGALVPVLLIYGSPDPLG